MCVYICTCIAIYIIHTCTRTHAHTQLIPYFPQRQARSYRDIRSYVVHFSLLMTLKIASCKNHSIKAQWLSIAILLGPQVTGR